MTFHVTFLWGSWIQIWSNFSKSTHLFLLHLPSARVKTWARLCLPQEPGQACRTAGVLLPHLMSMKKVAHWSVQDLPQVLQQLLLHTHNINLASERLPSDQTVCFFLWLLIQISIPLHVRPVSWRLLLILVLQLLPAMLPGTTINPFC